MTSHLTLRQVVNEQILQDIQDKFSFATGLGAVIVDVEGTPITRPSRFSSFCLWLREHPEGLRRCIACDDIGGRTAMGQQEPYIYLCHSGLTDLAVPIIVNNKYIGAFLAGQVIREDHVDQTVEHITTRLHDLNLDPEMIRTLLKDVEVLPYSRIKAAAELIYIISNYIVSMGLVNTMQSQLMRELEIKTNMESLLQQMELKALQSQVNPHFLFNTLNVIARLALMENAPKTEEVAYALSDLLRNNLREINQLNPLHQEVKAIQSYLLIQQVRFGSRLQAEFNIPDQLADQLLPLMTLQPLVENAIIHGIEHKTEGGKIRIEAKKSGGDLHILISDTGIGISPEKLATLLFPDPQKRILQGQTNGLGVNNVHKRIQHQFGKDYGLSFQSKLHYGTTVTIKLPLLESFTEGETVHYAQIAHC